LRRNIAKACPAGRIRFAPKSKIVVADQADLACPAMLEKIF
jgi:hypothetical protein